jgi:hypothetical protein
MNAAPLTRLGLLCILLTCAGCTYSTTGTLSRDPAAYLRIVGVIDADSVQIHDLSPVELTAKKATATVLITPGRHRIRLLRSGQIIVDRMVLVSDLQTLELRVP